MTKKVERLNWVESTPSTGSWRVEKVESPLGLNLSTLTPEPGESAKEKEERQLRELAEIFRLTQRPDESDFAFRRRVEQFNDRRIASIA